MARMDEPEVCKEESASLNDLRMLLRQNNAILDLMNEKLRELIYQLRRVIGDL